MAHTTPYHQQTSAENAVTRELPAVPLHPSFSSFGASCIHSSHHRLASAENVVQAMLVVLVTLGAVASLVL